MAQPPKPTITTSNDPFTVGNAADGSSGGPSKQPGVNVVTSEVNPNPKDASKKGWSALGKKRQSGNAPTPQPQQTTASPHKQTSAKGKPPENVPPVAGSSTSLPLKGAKEMTPAPKPKPAYRLNVYQAAPTPIASVDIIAVHDLEESQESAWTYELTSRHLNTKVKEVIQRELERETSPSSRERSRRNDMFSGGVDGSRNSSISGIRRDGPGPIPDFPSRPESMIRQAEYEPTFAAVYEESLDKGKSLDTPRSPDGKPDPIGMGGMETPGEGLPSPLNPRPMRTEPRDNKLKTSRRDNKESIKEKASIRSSSEFERPEKPRRVNWLRDFLTNDIPNSRVLAFSYPGPKFERKQPAAPGSSTDKKDKAAASSPGAGAGLGPGASTSTTPKKPGSGTTPATGTPIGNNAQTGQKWMEYVESAAKDLLQRIKRSRSIFYQKEVPIVFIGYGFGGIIIQKALELAAKENMPPRERPEKKETEEKPKEVKEENGSTSVPATTDNMKDATTPPALPPTPSEKPAEGPVKRPKPAPVKDPFPLQHVYQVLFLDTPFPKIHDSERGHLFPDNTNVRMCQILLEIEMREKGAKLVEKTWLSLQGRLEVVPTPLNFAVTWMYSHGRVKQPDGDAKSQLVREEEFNAMRKYKKQKMTFTSVSIYKHRRLARVPDTQDYIYKAICSRIQAKLLFQSIPVRNVALIQTILESKALPEEVEVKDWKGRTPLHYAAALYPPSEDIVTLLINERPSDTVEPDNDGRIPLHDAVLTAWEQEPPEGVDRSECSGVIRYLLRNMQRGDMEVQDNEGVSPWDQMTCEKEGCCCEEDECAAVWIQELRENLEPISGPAISQDYVLPTEPTPPEKDSAQYLATFTSQGAVSEFYHSFNQINHKLEEHINLKTPSVYEMIYDSDKGCARILEFSRRRESYQDFRCRWIHVPANNEQWLADLFLSMGIRDIAMDHQRHDGLTVFNRYMNPQAKKYEYVRFDLPNNSRFTTAPHLHLPTVPEENLKEFGPELPPDDIRMLGNTRAATQIIPSRTAWSDLPPIRETGGNQTIALFMPFLAYENHEGRKKNAKIIHRTRDPKAKSDKQADRDSALIKGYLTYNKGPLHCRRTLDQYSYYMLETTERRDKDQVVYRWAKEQGKAKSQIPLLMIDQLWLWILPDGTMITSLPNTQKPSESYNIKMLLSKEIETNKSRHAIQGPETLLDLVLKTCLNIMTRKGPGGVKLNECFQSSINKIAESEAITMKRLLKTVDKLADAPDPFALTAEIDSFSRISEESKQLVEIIDIQDELGIIKSVLTTQREVLKELRNHIAQTTHSHGTVTPQTTSAAHTAAIAAAMGSPGLGISPGGDGTQFNPMSPPAGMWNSTPSVSPFNGLATPNSAAPGMGEHHGSTVLKSTRVVDDAIRVVEDHILRVKEMNESAKRVQADLKQLLEFKQQQASGWESRYAMKLSEQGQRQNTIMLVFTIVTIIFLPLSFIASFFALQIREFPHEEGGDEPSWDLEQVSGLLFGISVAVSAVIIAGIGALFYRMSKRNKMRMDQLKKADKSSKPWSRSSKSSSSNSSGSKSKTGGENENRRPGDKPSSKDGGKSTGKNGATATRRRHRRKHGGGEDDSDSSDNDSDCSSASSSSSTSSDSSSKERDENEYAPLLNRWRWHTHIPLVRRLWVWKLYKVSSRKTALARRRKRSGVGGDSADLTLRKNNSAGENWEWDYPLSRARLMTFGLVYDKLLEAYRNVAGTRGMKGRKGERKKLKGDDDDSDSDEEREKDSGDYSDRRDGDESEDDDDHAGNEDEDDEEEEDCDSEDERVRREVLEAEHHERVEKRKKWLSGFVPGGYGGKLFGIGKEKRHHHHHHHHHHHGEHYVGRSESDERVMAGVSPTSPDVEWRENGADSELPRGRGSWTEQDNEGAATRGKGWMDVMKWRNRQRTTDEEMGGGPKRE
ncbi:hypothetical protein V8F33_011172 [Rhypophila sp. PSN 637]